MPSHAVRPKPASSSYGVEVARVQCKADAAELDSIRALVDAGRLQVFVATVLPLSDVGQALELSESRRTRGKIVLRIGA